jgi:DNA-binding MarR family transcriptional regulator
MKPGLGSRLNSATVHIGRALRSSSVGASMPIEHRSALSAIVFAGPIRMSALARLEGVSAPAVTRTVAILERQGLVRRHADPSDRRATLIVATAKGARLTMRGRDERARRIDAALRRMRPAARARIQAAIDDLEALVEEIGFRPR